MYECAWRCCSRSHLVCYSAQAATGKLPVPNQRTKTHHGWTNPDEEVPEPVDDGVGHSLIVTPSKSDTYIPGQFNRSEAPDKQYTSIRESNIELLSEPRLTSSDVALRSVRPLPDGHTEEDHHSDIHNFTKGLSSQVLRSMLLTRAWLVLVCEHMWCVGLLCLKRICLVAMIRVQSNHCIDTVCAVWWWLFVVCHSVHIMGVDGDIVHADSSPCEYIIYQGALAKAGSLV